MITYALTVSRSQIAAWVFLMAGSLLISMSALGAETNDDTRVAVTTEQSRVARDEGGAGHLKEHKSAELRTEGPRTRASRASRSAASANVDFWFYTADVELFNDHDDDGYYHGIDLLFDADTYFTVAEVYAVIYLSLDGGPWNEYAATDNFSLFGASSDDEYVIVTELVSGYPSGSYDILIELFDANDDSFLAYYGPEDTPELAFLPLEDADRDFPEPPVVVINRRGGGSTGALFILALVAARWFRVARSA